MTEPTVDEYRAAMVDAAWQIADDHTPVGEVCPICKVAPCPARLDAIGYLITVYRDRDPVGDMERYRALADLARRVWGSRGSA